MLFYVIVGVDVLSRFVHRLQVRVRQTQNLWSAHDNTRQRACVQLPSWHAEILFVLSSVCKTMITPISCCLQLIALLRERFVRPGSSSSGVSSCWICRIDAYSAQAQPMKRNVFLLPSAVANPFLSQQVIPRVFYPSVLLCATDHVLLSFSST